ncbi:hypothetical protein AB0K52_25235 [Glycomyces sp. NPDC049804]|uniref:hypothetical protein n=1 Tax=Glycomyces sp. NPDC049804 TaxID=3154363 RepID=UPI003418B5AD
MYPEPAPAVPPDEPAPPAPPPDEPAPPGPPPVPPSATPPAGQQPSTPLFPPQGAPAPVFPQQSVPAPAFPPNELPSGPSAFVPPSAPVPAAFPPPPPAPRRPARPVRATDPVAAVAGNATMLGLGYMLMRRPILAALALCGTGFLVWSAAVQTENPLWRYLLPAWGLVMILHAWWLTRRARPEPLVDLLEPDPARRLRVWALTAAALVLLTVGWFRLDAWWIVHDAETAHARGDCVEAEAALGTLDAVHRVAFGPIVERGEEEGDACALLLAALAEGEESPAAAAGTIGTYLDHPGALWGGAGVKRGEFLLQAAIRDGDPSLHNVEEGFAQLADTLEAHPDQSDAVRATVEGFMADLAEAASPCTGYTVDDWLASREWGAAELAEPIADAADQVPGRLLGCAQERDGSDPVSAGILYREFLTAYPDHELAVEAAEGVLASGGYCTNPVAYQGAPAADGPGPHPMRLLGGWGSDDRGFPESWIAETADETALVVCVDAELGEYQDSCMYRSTTTGATRWATFFAHRFTIKAYSLRTGEVVADYAREIGRACPDRLDGSYSTIYISSSDTSLTMASEYTDEDFRNMFADLMD